MSTRIPSYIGMFQLQWVSTIFLNFALRLDLAASLVGAFTLIESKGEGSFCRGWADHLNPITSSLRQARCFTIALFV